MAANTGNAQSGHWSRLLALLSTVIELVRSGRRSLEELVDLLQLVKDSPDFMKQAVTPLTRTRLLQPWRQFYLAHGIEFDYEKISIPEKPEGDGWQLVVVPDGMTVRNAIQLAGGSYGAAMRACGSPEFLDDASLGEYTFWAKDSWEPDQLGIYPLQVPFSNSPRAKRAMALKEYFLHHAFVYEQTGRRLDTDSVTHIFGQGRDLWVCWDGHGFRVESFLGTHIWPTFGSRLIYL